MNKRLEHIIKAIAFMICVIVMLAATFNVLWLNENNHFRPAMKKFYNLPEDTCDVILLGPSSVREYYIAPLAYNDTGLASYSLACGMQSFDASRYLISEAEKTQSPRVYVIDIRALSDIASYYYSEISIRRVADAMRVTSPERIAFINHMYDRWSEYTNYNSNRWEFYYGATIYHNRWEDINKEDFGIEDGSWMGYNLIEETTVIDPDERERCMTEERGELSAYAKEILTDFMNYSKENNINVLFINMPGSYSERVNSAANSVKDMVSAEGFEFLDLNLLTDEIGIDWETDMKNTDHVNTRGAIKVTRYLAYYLREHYGLADRRTDNTGNYKIWNDEYLSFAEAAKEYLQ